MSEAELPDQAGGTLAALAARFLARPPGVAAQAATSDVDVGGLRRRLDAAATTLEPALAARGIGELSLTKERIGALGDCERFAGALLAGRVELGDVDAMARGVLLETLVRAHVTRGVRPYCGPSEPREMLELAVALIRAEGADREEDPVRRRCLALAPEEVDAWASSLARRFTDLVASWPQLDEAWWPRTEEPARVACGSGTVALAGRFDVLLGGTPTAFPLVVVELKSGALYPRYVEDQRFYALLATLRDGAPPAAVLTCAAGGDGPAVATDVIDAPLLDTALGRVEQAIGALGHLLSGGPPAERPGWRCGHCPERGVCPSFVEPGAVGASGTSRRPGVAS